MKFKSARFIGLIGVCRASGLKEIFIDFTKCTHKIVLIMGKNGSGKSTIEDALTPFPDPISKYLPHEEGLKEIEYIMNDGTEYKIRIEYPINKMGERIQTKAYIEKNVNGNIIELNPNGNIGSYKDVLYNEFYLDSNFIALSQLSVENRGLVEKTPAERKKFVANGAIINSIEVYNNIYTTLNKRSSIFKSMINSIVAKIDSIGNEENIVSTLVSLDNRIKRLEINKNQLTKELSDVESIVKLTDPNGELQHKYSTLQVQIKSIQDELDTINLFLKQIDSKSKNEPYSLMTSLENCILYEKELNRKIIKLQSEIDQTKDQIQSSLVSREEESKSINLKVTRLKALQSEYNYQDLLEEMKKTKKNISDDLAMFQSIGVSPETTISKDEFATGLNTLKLLKEQVDIIRSYHYDSEIQVAVDYELNGKSIMDDIHKVESKIDELTLQKMEVRENIKYYNGLMDRLDILDQRPETCTIDTCSFIKDALDAKKEQPEIKLEELYELQKDLIVQYEKFSEKESFLKNVSKVSYSIQIIIRYINNNRTILDKLPNGHIFSDENEFLNRLLNGSTFDDINILYQYIDQANVFEDYKYNLEVLKSLESEYKIYQSKTIIIEEIENDIESIQIKLDKITKEIDTKNQIILEKQKELQRSHSCIEVLINTKDKYIHKKELESSLREKLSELESIANKMKEIEESIQRINTINQSILNIDNELIPIKNERDKLKFSMDRLVEYKSELQVYQDKYEKIELIKKYSSPSKAGIQNLFIEVYMGQTLNLANQLLSKLFNGTLELDRYIINDKEFRIPCKSLESSIVNDDISSCSTAQKCMISMIISFALLKQGSTKYNILRLDEIDGGLDQDNRAMFIDVLNEIMDIMEVQHCIMISHSSEAVLEDTDIILLSPVGGDIPKGNIIFTY